MRTVETKLNLSTIRHNYNAVQKILNPSTISKRQLPIVPQEYDPREDDSWWEKRLSGAARGNHRYDHDIPARGLPPEKVKVPTATEAERVANADTPIETILAEHRRRLCAANPILIGRPVK